MQVPVLSIPAGVAHVCIDQNSMSTSNMKTNSLALGMQISATCGSDAICEMGER